VEAAQDLIIVQRLLLKLVVLVVVEHIVLEVLLVVVQQVIHHQLRHHKGIVVVLKMELFEVEAVAVAQVQQVETQLHPQQKQVMVEMEQPHLFQVVQ
jgi:hypothetical protein